jgi:hypothetical protein
MRRLVILAILLLAASCGGGARIASTPLSLGGGFNLSDTSTIGGGKLIAAVTGDAAAPVVIISVENASDLKGAIFTLNYPSDKCHAESVEFSELLGGAGDTISLGITDRAGIVPAGIVKIHPDTAAGVNGAGEIARISFAPGAAVNKAVSSAPMGDGNKPNDLTIIETGTPGTYQLTWHERHVGDYDNNGEVSISDITPIAMHYGHSNADPADELIAGDGVVGVPNITGIAMNLGTSLAGYNVYAAGDSNPKPNNGVPTAPYSVMRPTPPPVGRIDYTYLIDLASQSEVRVRPVDDNGVEGVESDPAIPGSGTAPAAPANLGSNASENVGVGRILLAWSANSEADLLEYRVYRQDGVGAFTQVATVPAATVPLLYNDSNGGALLPAGSDYTYYVTAVNTVNMESGESNHTANAPFYPAAPGAPASITTTGQGIPVSYAIKVEWGASVSNYLEGYEIWRTGPDNSNFALLQTASAGASRSIFDGGLTAGKTYTYKVRAYDQFGQFSGFTAESACQPSDHIALAINSVTTDNTTLTLGSVTEKAHLAVDTNNPAATISWTASVGTFNNPASLTPTYSPPGAAAGPQKVTITVHANDGIADVSGTVDVILTGLPLLGPGIDFSMASRLAPNTPYIPFADYMDDGKVILLNFGAQW